jgi:hypothetical protein
MIFQSFTTSFLLSIALSAVGVHGFYLPGVAPYNFYAGESIDLKVNKLR